MEKLVHIGKARRPHGVKGEIGVTWNNTEAPIEEGVFVILKLAGKDSKFKIEKIRRGTGKSIAKLSDVNDRDKASELTNSAIYAYASDLIKLNENQYYVHQLIGLDVINEKNENIGKVNAVYPTGSNDVYEITHNEKTFLIPAISSVIKKIDLKKNIINIETIKGLLDDEEE